MAPSATAIQFDSILARVANGETLTESCRALGIKRGTLNSHLRAHPDLRARLDAAKPKTGIALVAERFSSICAEIEAGSTMEVAVANAGCSVPSFLKYVRKHDASDRYVSATEMRETGDAARGKRATARQQPRLKPDDFEAALQALSDATRKYEDIFSDRLMPSDRSVANYARKNASFRARLADVMASRRQARSDARPKPEPKIERPLGQLLKALKLNPLYAAAFREVGGLDPVDRDDAISELILSVLEGDLPVDEIKTTGRRHAIRRVFGDRSRSVSLDVTHFNTSNADTLGDMIANDDQILFY